MVAEERRCLLDRLFGLGEPVAAIRRAIETGQAGGSMLFVGPEGVGKTTLAEAFGAVLACTGRGAGSSAMCGDCASCRLALAGTHPEILHIEPAGDQTQIWQFWDRPGRPEGALQRGLAFAPVVGAKRVFIVTRADTLTSAAANSLLKVLEEPPPYAVFILLAPNASRLLPTILSRCRIVRCLPAPIDDLAAYLEASRQIDPERARSLAALAEGRTGEALRLSSDPVRMEAIRAVTCLGLQLPGAGLVRSLKLSEALRKAGAAPKSLSEAGPEENGGEPVRDRAARGQLGATLDRLLAVYRDLLHASVAGDEAPLVHIEASEDLLRVGGSRPPASWMRDIETLSRARERLERNVSLALLSDWLAVELGR